MFCSVLVFICLFIFPFFFGGGGGSCLIGTQGDLLLCRQRCQGRELLGIERPLIFLFLTVIFSLA